MKRSVVASCLVLLLVSLPAAQSSSNKYAPDTPEPGSVDAIAKFTTEARFNNPWVAYVPEAAGVPSPTDYLGHVAGAAGELSNTTKIYGYFRELDKASDRVRVEVIGKTEEGRDILLVAVADDEGIRDIDRLKAATAALADPRKTDPDEAERIIATARPIYYFNAGLHSTETGSPEMVMEMAYRLAVSQQPMIDQIRKNVLVLINPVSEPDGRDKVVDWYYRYLKGKTDFENLPRRSPPYWGHYVYHDNNRDTHQKALQITRAVHRMFYSYHPTVVHDLHESIPLLQTWNGTGPWNPNLDPIVINELFEMSFTEIGALSGMGMPGVWTWGFGEGWGHHYLDSVAINHNAIGRGYETFGNSTPETVERTLRNERYVGRPVTSREWYRPFPPDRRFKWSMRNNTNYMQSGCLAILQYASRNPKEMLRNFYRKGYNSWQKGVNGKPHAFVIPENQGDPRRVADMINLLMSHGIEVGRATASFTNGGTEYPARTYVIKLDQPYRNYAIDLLAPQKFPADTQYEPYDDVSWALPVHYGLEAKAIDEAAIKHVQVEAISGDVKPVGTVTGTGAAYLLKDTGQERLLAARHRLAKFTVSIAQAAFTAAGLEYPAGSWIVPVQDGVRPALEQAASELALDFAAVDTVPTVGKHNATIPRFAVWHTWADTESVGWVRYTLDQEKIPFTYIRDEEIKAGNLRSRFDVILYGNVYTNLQSQIHGIDPKFGPMPYTKTKDFPSHGVPDASDDITGGIGWKGMANLQQFLQEGGLFIALGNASALPIEGGLVRDVRRGGGNVNTPGVEVKAKFLDRDHPIAYGYPEITSAFRGEYPVYQVAPRDRGFIVLQWGTRLPRDERDDQPSESADEGSSGTAKTDGGGSGLAGPLVVSGGMKGDDQLEGHAAILDIPAGKGRVIAFNFNPMHRDLNRSDYRMLWNAILNWEKILGRR